MIKKSLQLCAVLLIGLVQSCSSADNETDIYKVGREWTFKVHFYKDNLLYDSCSLLMAVEKKNFLAVIQGQKNLTYRYQDCCADSIYETTGVLEKDGVFIHPPRMGCFAFTHVSPMPTVNYPMSIGSQADVELKIVKSPFKGLSGITLQQHRQVTGERKYMFNDSAIHCYVTTGKNTSHIEKLGQYKNEFLFNQQYGFVMLVYENPDGQRVEFKLISTNF